MVSEASHLCLRDTNARVSCAFAINLGEITRHNFLSHVAMSCTGRVFPLRQPKGHRPPVPRWMAQFPADMDRVFTAYIGVQQRGAQTDEGLLAESVDAAVNSIQRWIAEGPSTAPASIEQFQVLDGDDVPNSTVWVCYWNEASKYEDSIRRLSLVNIHEQLSASHRESVGLWCERFASHLSRVRPTIQVWTIYRGWLACLECQL